MLVVAVEAVLVVLIVVVVAAAVVKTVAVVFGSNGGCRFSSVTSGSGSSANSDNYWSGARSSGGGSFSSVNSGSGSSGSSDICSSRTTVAMSTIGTIAAIVQAGTVALDVA